MQAGRDTLKRMGEQAGNLGQHADSYRGQFLNYIDSGWESAPKALFPTKASFYYTAFTGLTMGSNMAMHFLWGRTAGILSALAMGIFMGNAQVKNEGECEDVCSPVKEYQGEFLSKGHFMLWGINTVMCCISQKVLSIVISQVALLAVQKPLANVVGNIAAVYLLAQAMDFRFDEDTTLMGMKFKAENSVMCSLENKLCEMLSGRTRGEGIEL